MARKSKLPALPTGTPDSVRTALQDVARDVRVVDMMERADEFRTPVEAMLAGIACDPGAREAFDADLESIFDYEAERRVELASKKGGVDEVVVGGGLHAAIYCAIRVAKGFRRPVVIERKRVGGTFGHAAAATFYLNSRNRPGELGLPGRDGALNVLPGAMIQPAALSGAEYQSNDDMAFAIRSTLAMAAYPMNATVAEVRKSTTTGRRPWRVVLENGKEIEASRVVWATGLGDERAYSDFGLKSGTERVFSFTDFMAHMGSEKWPLRGMRNVAVVGGGDSARTAVEALTGQGPGRHMSVSALDTVERITWYGIPNGAANRKGWEACERSRYRGLGRMMRDDDGEFTGGTRITGLTERATVVDLGYGCVYVNSVPYDAVVLCTGWQLQNRPVPTTGYAAGDRLLGRTADGNRFVVVGPAAKIAINEGERDALGDSAKVPENSTAIFRYAERTAFVAASLDAAEFRNPEQPRLSNRILDMNALAGTPLITSVFATSGRPVLPDPRYVVTEARQARENPARAIARDRYGRPLFVGTTVRAPRPADGIPNGVVGRVEGLARGYKPASSPIIIVGGTGRPFEDTTDLGVPGVRILSNVVEVAGVTTDRNGVSLAVGDPVTVYDSGRFGTVDGTVAGVTEGRIRVPLPEDPDYTASRRRVELRDPSNPSEI